MAKDVCAKAGRGTAHTLSNPPVCSKPSPPLALQDLHFCPGCQNFQLCLCTHTFWGLYSDCHLFRIFQTELLIFQSNGAFGPTDQMIGRELVCGLDQALGLGTAPSYMPRLGPRGPAVPHPSHPHARINFWEPNTTPSCSLNAGTTLLTPHMPGLSSGSPVPPSSAPYTGIRPRVHLELIHFNLF